MPATEYDAAVLADTPRIYWKFQESSGLAQDSSGNAQHANATFGSPSYAQTGFFGGSDRAIGFASGAAFSESSPSRPATFEAAA